MLSLAISLCFLVLSSPFSSVRLIRCSECALIHSLSVERQTRLTKMCASLTKKARNKPDIQRKQQTFGQINRPHLKIFQCCATDSFSFLPWLPPLFFFSVCPTMSAFILNESTWIRYVYQLKWNGNEWMQIIANTKRHIAPLNQQ